MDPRSRALLLTFPATLSDDWLMSASGIAGFPDAASIASPPAPPVPVTVPVLRVPSPAMGKATTAFWTSLVIKYSALPADEEQGAGALRAREAKRRIETSDLIAMAAEGVSVI